MGAAIDPEALAISQKIKQRMVELKHPPLRDLDTLDINDARYFFHEGNKLYDLRLEAGVDVKAQQIKRLDQPPLNVRIYRPSPPQHFASDKGAIARPILVYLQGGGWVFSSSDSVDDTCSFLAKYADCIVVSVGYRLAPEHKYPLPVLDALDGVHWAYDHAEDLGGDRQRLAIGGESAGGNLAAVVAIKLRNEGKIPLIGQLLITPVTQYGFDTPSYKAGHRCGLSPEAMHWFWHHYLDSPDQGEQWDASPLKVEDASNLPPTIMVVAEHDPLCDEGLMYAEYLKASNNNVKILRYPSLIHGFIRLTHKVKVARFALQEIAENLKECLFFNPA